MAKKKALDPWKKVTVELAAPVARGGVQYKKGDEVEVYPNEARELAVSGAITSDVEEYASEVEKEGGYFNEYNSANVEPGPSVDEISTLETKDAKLNESSVQTDEDSGDTTNV